MMQQTLLCYKLPQALANPDKLIPNSWAFYCPVPLTKHPETRGGINEKTFRDLGSVFGFNVG